MQGKLIVIEGLDGSGKSTQIELIKSHLESSNINYKQIKLPNYEDNSSALVKMYLAGEFGKNPQDVNAYAASTFYAVDRFASYSKIWKSDYLQGRVIIADRYTTSNAYHQMMKLPKNDWDAYLEWLEDFEYNKIGIPKPDSVIYLDMPIEISQKLMTKRYSGNEQKKDVHESNINYLTACRESALYASDYLDWHIIKCNNGDNPRSIEEINYDIMQIVEKEIL